MKAVFKYKCNIEIILYCIFNFIFLLNLYLNKDIKLHLYACICIIYLLYLLKNFIRIYKLNKYVYLYVIYVSFLLFLGVYNKNYNSYLFYDFLGFFSILFILLPFSYKDTSCFFNKYLPKIGVYLNILCIVFAIIFILKRGILISTMEDRLMYGEQEGEVLSPKFFLYPSLFLYPLIGYLDSKKDKYIYNISILLFIFFSLIMAARGSTVVALIVISLSNILIKKQITIVKFVRYLCICVCLLSIIYCIPVLKSSIEYLVYRYENEQLTGVRMEEATDILNNLTRKQFVFGKGLGGANTYWIFSDLPHGVNTVHYGWAFLILKGGIILLCLIYGKILLSIWKLWKTRDKIPYAIILITFLLLEFSHTNFNSIQNLSFMFIALSYSFEGKISK